MQRAHAGIFALRSRCGGLRGFVAQCVARDSAAGSADQSDSKFPGQENPGNPEGDARKTQREIPLVLGGVWTGAQAGSARLGGETGAAAAVAAVPIQPS